MIDSHALFRVSLHEAGHVLYGLECGAIGAVIHAPSEEWNAAVQLLYTKEDYFPDPHAFARMMSAGGVVSRTMTSDPAGRNSDWHDLQLFQSSLLERGFSAEDVNARWTQAQHEVEEDLCKPAVRDLLHSLAGQIESFIRAAEHAPNRELKYFFEFPPPS